MQSCLRLICVPAQQSCVSELSDHLLCTQRSRGSYGQSIQLRESMWLAARLQAAIPAVFEQQERAEQERASAALAAQLEASPSPSHAMQAHLWSLTMT